ncbi:MAG: histidinol dehydrogenase [Thermodesulfobacteriaceae bacterium]|nr:histidinol dehydrogenase [Thermodesulfobacteriaceae bacterium]
MKIRVFKYPSKKAKLFLKKLEDRVESFPEKIEREVKKIGNRVRKEGDKALIEYTSKFDGVLMTSKEFRVEEEEIRRAYQEVSEELLSAIRLAIEKIRKFHLKGLSLSWFEYEEEGLVLGQLVRAVESVGLYIPGGKAGETPLISTVIMSAIPAKIAGVKKLVMVSPPRKNKTLHPALLVAAKEAEIDEIYKIGGPWSIFGLAYGTETLPKVEMICGPGNIYVTLAKKIVSSWVGIDLLAGPSEVLIIADQSAPSEFIVWDLLAQAEHDPFSLPLLITNSAKLVKEVKEKLFLALKEGVRSEIASKALSQRGGIILVKDLRTAFEISNLIAPEHLEIMLENPWEWLYLVKNAGAVFLGAYTPEAIGDYLAGPNHILPTMGLARFTSSLSTEKFLKKINFMQYSFSSLKKEAQAVINLAEAENLPFHAQAVKIRLEKMERGLPKNERIF